MIGSRLFNIISPILSNETWTHLAVIYSTTNGYRLFINGQLKGLVVTDIVNNNFNVFVTLGNNSPGLNISSSTCLASPIVAGV